MYICIAQSECLEEEGDSVFRTTGSDEKIKIREKKAESMFLSQSRGLERIKLDLAFAGGYGRSKELHGSS